MEKDCGDNRFGLLMTGLIVVLIIAGLIWNGARKENSSAEKAVLVWNIAEVDENV